MRTTVTLAPDTDAYIRRLMKSRGLTFGQAVNEAIRASLGRGPGGHGRQVTYTHPKPMGVAAVPLDKALQLAGQMEDDEIVRKLALRK
jgi:hypothetical protein